MNEPKDTPAPITRTEWVIFGIVFAALYGSFLVYVLFSGTPR